MPSWKSFASNILRGSFWLSSSALAMRFIGLLTTFLILGSLGLTEYGIYKLVLAAAGIFMGFLFGGFDVLVINEAVLQSSEGRHDKVKRLFLEFAGMKFGIGLFLFLLIQAGSHVLVRWLDPEVVKLLPLISYQFLFTAVERPMNLAFNLYAKFRSMAVMPLIDEAAKLGLVLLFAVHLGWQAYGVLLADVLATALGVTVFLPSFAMLARRILTASISRQSQMWEIMRTYGKWAIASRYLDEARKSIRPWLIKFFLGTEAVAIYAVAESLVLQVTSLMPLSSVLAPLLPRELQDRNRVRNLLIVGTKYGTPFFLALTAAAAIFMPFLVGFLFPPYIPSIGLFLIMVAAVSATAVASILTSILYAERQQRAQFFITLLTVLFMIFAGWQLVRVFGLRGMAFEFLLTLVFYNALKLSFLFFSYPELRFGISELFSWSERDRQFVRFLKSTSFERLRPIFSRPAS